MKSVLPVEGTRRDVRSTREALVKSITDFWLANVKPPQQPRRGQAAAG